MTTATRALVLMAAELLISGCSSNDQPGGSAGTGYAGTGGFSGTSVVDTDAGVAGTGGAAGTDVVGDAGVVGDSGGLGGVGGAGGTGGGTGGIEIADLVPGWASVPAGSLSNGTTGGGQNIGAAITVSSMSALQNAASGSGAAIILVQPGTYTGALQPGANKTIIGTGPGVTLQGRIDIGGADRNNIIIRNIAVRGDPCSSYDECRAGADAVYIGNGAHHVWLDHMDIADGQDGNCDITRAGDYVTVSWTKFHYTYTKEHAFSNLIAGSDEETESRGKLQITYMNCWWGERVDTRQPRGRFGKIHMLNNYHNTGGGQIHGVGVEMSLIAENCVYHETRSIWTDMGSPTGWRGVGNEGTAQNMNDSHGSVFTIPYAYTAMPASQVVAALTSTNCGSGNTCHFQ